MLTIKYQGDTFVDSPLEHSAALIMLTGQGVNLGRLRLATRRFQEQYAGAMAAV